MRAALAALLLSAIGCGLSPDSICDDVNNPCPGAQACVLGKCQELSSASCTDDAQNGDETDVDCGGSCSPCGATLKCGKASDCASTLCVNNACDCPPGQHVQATSCVDNSDTACGKPPVDCTTAFSGGQGVCNAQAGACVLTSCNSGAHLCGGACASDTSAQTCGLSCSPCTAPANGSATCDSGACGIECNPAFHVNGASCDADSNTACGSPTNDCTAAFANGTGTCTPSTASTPAACSLSGCNTGYHAVGEACVSDAVNACAGVDCTDAAHQDAHGTMTCAGGTCEVASCNQGYHPNSSSTACDVSSDTCCGPGPGCKNCQTSFTNGAGVCAVNGSTPNGACTVSTCSAGFHPDGSTNSCAANSNTACGSPTNDCTKIANSTSTCNVTAGTCTVSCNTGYHLFQGGCEANSDTICGSGRTNCTTQYLNGNGACNTSTGTCFLASCVGGYHVCGGSCASNSSLNSCGSSCSPCPTDPHGTATCNGTFCDISCNSGYNDCDGSGCSPYTVTSCGPQCADCTEGGPGYACSGSTCKCTLPPGQVCGQ
ncbi:MAG TPA: hypothetical protein VLW85_02525 [Myxococcales bacterium]|nr:hypothetical protein [Myxococcales bacterium]